LTQTAPPPTILVMNKRKRVAWEKHRKTAKKADEKRKPGTMSKLFRSHPPHGKRIVKVQGTIDELLPNKPEYVVSTSEFLEVKSQLMASVTRGVQKAEEEDANKPTLRRPSGDPTIPADDEEPETEQDDGRPTLKRR